MLETMSNLTLCYLWNNFNGTEVPSVSLYKWFREKRTNDSAAFFPYLVESPGKIEKFYTLSPDPIDTDTAILESADLASLGEETLSRIPYIQTPPNSPDLGPVLKRSLDGTNVKPKPAMLERLLKQLESNMSKGVKEYAREAAKVWRRPKLKYKGEIYEKGKALLVAFQLIPENNTVFVAYRDQLGRLPGDVPEYRKFLDSELQQRKYATTDCPSVEGTCSLCSAKTIVYPNGTAGAGLNISNVDRPGAFPGITKNNAELGYPLCGDCADLLYIYRFSVLPRLTTRIAGDKATLIPKLHIQNKTLPQAVQLFSTYVAGIKKSPERAIGYENRLLRKIAENQSVISIDILWADFSQGISDIRGQVTEILPSRLRSLAQLNKSFNDRFWNDHPFAPKHPVDNFQFDLGLTFLQPLLNRPGGKRAANTNASANLFEVKRLITASVYSNQYLPQNGKRFWNEVLETARWYIGDAIKDDHPENKLLYEGYSKRKSASWLTLAGWVRYLALVLTYFEFVNVKKKEKTMRTFTPKSEKLKPYFTDDGGINTDEKAFAFTLGVLYGRLMRIQAARGVNVGANALTWLKRLRLSGDDLPELFVKIREKLLAYEAEKSQLVRDVMEDMATLGCKLGNQINLSQVDTCYFLLLGQAVSNEVFKNEQEQVEVEAEQV